MKLTFEDHIKWAQDYYSAQRVKHRNWERKKLAENQKAKKAIN